MRPPRATTRRSSGSSAAHPPADDTSREGSVRRALLIHSPTRSPRRPGWIVARRSPSWRSPWLALALAVTCCPIATRDPCSHRGAVLVVAVRRPSLRVARATRVHRLHRHGRPDRDRGLRPRDGPPPAADALRPARGRRPQQPEPRHLPRASVRVLVAPQRLPLPAQPPQPHALPRVRSGRGPTAAAGAVRGRSRSGAGAASATRIRTRSSRATGSISSCAARAGRRTSRPQSTACAGPARDRSSTARRLLSTTAARCGARGRTRSTPTRPTARS